MNRWIVPLLSLLLVALLLLISSPFNVFRSSMNAKESEEKSGIVFVQDEGEKGQTYPHLILVLKRLREKLDKWLKSINDRIESENVTHIEVRFLEILRSILEWVREKVDAKITSFEKEKPKEAHQRLFPFLDAGWYCAV